MLKKNLIKIIYGYRNLFKANKLDTISKYQEEISKINLLDNSIVNNFFFPKSKYDKNTVFINFFLSKIGISNLRYYLIKSFSGEEKFIAPLPNEWLNYLVKNDFKVNMFLSKLLFKFIVLKYFFCGILINLKITLLIIKNFFSNDFKNFIFFNNISPTNLPSFSNKLEINSKKKYSFYDFYKLNIGNNENKLFLFSTANKELKKINSKKIENDTFSFSNYPVLVSLPFKDFIIFIKDTFVKIFLSLISLITGKYWNVFLLGEQPLMSISRIKAKDHLPEEIFFHLSDLYHRPLWTYEMENRGTNIYMIWYSTNNQANYNRTIEDKFFYDWSKIIWQNHIVWNENHKKWLSKYLKDKNQNIIFYNYLWFNDFPISLNLSNDRKYISVFPVAPYRKAYFSLFNEDEYQILTCKNQIKFIKDILESAMEKKYMILIKNKRILGPHHDKMFVNFLDNVDDRYIKIIKEDISPVKLLKKSVGSINFPFTSTAYLALNSGLPTAYYDVTGRLKNFSLDQNIDLLNNRSQLSEWINSLK